MTDIKAVQKLTLKEWQAYVNAYTGAPTNKAPKAMRIDGTQLSVMRHYGGGFYQGSPYVVFVDKNVKGQLTCKYATIAVRDDVVKWVVAQVKAAKRKAREAAKERKAKE